MRSPYGPRSWAAGATGDAVFTMKSVARVCAIAGALTVGGCASWTPSWDWIPSSLSSGANVSLTIESDPPGADAKTSLGASCRTPCMIPVPGDREFTVNYSLPGYLPQVIPVRPGVLGNSQIDVAGGYADDVRPPELTPNPVYAQLQPAPPPAPARTKGRPRAKQPPPPRQ